MHLSIWGCFLVPTTPDLLSLISPTKCSGSDYAVIWRLTITQGTIHVHFQIEMKLSHNSSMIDVFLMGQQRKNKQENESHSLKHKGNIHGQEDIKSNIKSVSTCDQQHY
ncbi:hypothetical protein ACJX0J_035425 [Zea mays]